MSTEHARLTRNRDMLVGTAYSIFLFLTMGQNLRSGLQR
jgi:hypothetical protein